MTSSELPIHGGSLRIYVEPKEAVRIPSRICSAKRRQLGIDGYPYYEKFANRVKDIRKSLREMCSKIKAEGKKIAAYGAAAKGSTLVNYVGPRNRHDRFRCRSKRTQAGQIHARRAHSDPRSRPLMQEKPDYVLCFLGISRMKSSSSRTRYRKSGGQFIIPIPTPHIV